jgi:spermidine synthase
MKRNLVLLWIALSGAAGLIYEVVWLKKAALVTGAATPALSTVLAVFFGGLAIGAWVFGRWSARLARPLHVYALLELALAALGLLATFAFGPLDAVYGRAFAALADQPAALTMVRTLLIAAVLLPPTVLMGGTLPLIARQFATERDHLAGTVAWLYALNTLGAAAGCALAGFVLVPALGIWGTALVAAACNAVAGVGVLLARLPAPDLAGDQAIETTSTRGRAAHGSPPAGENARAGAWLTAAIFALLGGTSLAGEVLWSRFLTLLVHDTVYTWTITLTVVLLGIVIGSWLAGRLADRVADPALLLGALMGLAAVTGILMPLLPPRWWQGLGESAWPFVLVLLPPAVFAGACLPAALRLVAREPALVGLDLGRLTALNTGGGILGSLLAGFVLLPGVGLHRSLLIVSGAALLGALAALVALPGPRRARRLGVAAAVGMAWLAIPLASDVRLPADYLAPRGSLLAWDEGRASTLAVVRHGEHRVLQIDRLWQGRDERNHQIVAAHVPALLHPDPRSVCVVGAGVGQTASRFLMHGIDHLDCVDIEPAVFPFIREHFDATWLDDPRVRAVGEDGRNWIVHGESAYDLVSIEIGQTFRPGAEAFYTREFYAAVAAKLAPGGLVSQFVPLPFLDEASLRDILATFLDVFPRAILWYNTAELLLIGGEWRLDPDRLGLVERDPRLHADLAYSQWGGTDVYLDQLGPLLGGFLCGPDELADLAAGGRILHDDRPRLAYVARDARQEQDRTAPLVPLLRDHARSPAALLTFAVPQPVLDAAARTQGGNLNDLLAAGHVARADRLRAQGDLAGAVDALGEALRANPMSAEAARVLGDVLAQAGRPREAARWQRRALDLRPDDHVVARGLAGSLVQLGRAAEAEPIARRVVEARPRDADAWNTLGAALAAQGELAEAIACFERTRTLRPGDQAAVQNLQRARAQLRQQRGN